MSSKTLQKVLERIRPCSIHTHDSFYPLCISDFIDEWVYLFGISLVNFMSTRCICYLYHQRMENIILVYPSIYFKMPNANVSREILKTRKIQEAKESAHKSRIRKVLAGLFMWILHFVSLDLSTFYQFEWLFMCNTLQILV